uniref:Uncharacterized protein n=1 Tax=Anguilla anguilla TaxID=7936 RepID=A0A0E9TN85_ANGAN
MAQPPIRQWRFCMHTHIQCVWLRLAD